jgi:hypothetical protein
MKHIPKRHRLTLEPLENRQLLAGNISIETSDGNLVILGDALSNRISIRQTGLGQFTVTGNDGEQFRTPGGLYQKTPVKVANVRGGLLVSLASGNDSVQIQGLGSSRSLGAFVTVLTGPGKDEVVIREVQTGGLQYPPQIKVPTELNRQRAAIGNSAYWNATTPGSITIDTGAGDRASDGDTVSLQSINVEGPTMINTGFGADQVKLNGMTGRQAVINTSAGSDRVELAQQASVSFDTLNITMGDDNDYVNIGTGPFQLTSINTSRFEGGRGVNILTGYGNLDAKTRKRLIDPRLTGFLVDPARTAVSTQ